LLNLPIWIVGLYPLNGTNPVRRQVEILLALGIRNAVFAAVMGFSPFADRLP